MIYTVVYSSRIGLQAFLERAPFFFGGIKNKKYQVLVVTGP